MLAKDYNPWHSNDTPGSFDCSERHWINGFVISVSLTLTLGLKYEWANNMGVSMKHKAWVLWVIQRSNNQLKRRGNFRKLKGKLSGFHWKSKITSTQRLLKTQAHFNSKTPEALLFSHNHGPKEASQELENWGSAMN